MHRSAAALLKVGVLLLLTALVSTAAAQAPRGWTAVAPPDMGFRAVFPRPPGHRSTTHHVNAGTWVGSTWELDDVARDRAFQVTVKDYRDYSTLGASIDAMLDSMCRGYDPDAVFQPLEAPVPARRCMSERGVGGTEMRVYWVAPRLYVASHICGSGDCTADRARFFDGFQLVR
ncbi:MAG: hypothetical protein AB8I08_04160 [Sandaracinaceae bacterium]